MGPLKTDLYILINSKMQISTNKYPDTMLTNHRLQCIDTINENT